MSKKDYDLDNDAVRYGLAVHISEALDPNDRKNCLPLFDKLCTLIFEWKEQQKAHV